MSLTTRRKVLATASGTFATLIAGCGNQTTTGTTTGTEAPFTDVSMAEAPAGCPMPDYASHARTPAPYPTPSLSSSDQAAADLAVNMEAAYLTNWVTKNRTPKPTPTQTRSSTAHPTVDYPAVEATYDNKTVYRFDGGAIVHLEYIRTVGDDRQSKYTVNYYFAEDAVARAEASGYSSPGPHPIKDGIVLTCWE